MAGCCVGIGDRFVHAQLDALDQLGGVSWGVRVRMVARVVRPWGARVVGGFVRGGVAFGYAGAR